MQFENLERIFDELKDKSVSACKRKQALIDLEKIASDPDKDHDAWLSHIEVWRRMGGFSVLTNLFKSDDDEIVELVSNAMSSLTPTSRRPSERLVHICQFQIRFKELEYSVSGSAYNVWTAALILSTWIAKDQDLKEWIHAYKDEERFLNAIEIGSGLGLCGLVLAKVCQTINDTAVPFDEHRQSRRWFKVSLSDLVPAVLENLRCSIDCNGLGDCARAVRMDWAEEAGISSGSSQRSWYGGEGKDGPSEVGLAENENFQLLLGSDVCYDEDHPELVAGLVRRRLASGGRLLLCCAVRVSTFHEALMERLQACCRCDSPPAQTGGAIIMSGSHVECEAVDSEAERWGLRLPEEACAQHSRSYPGGMVLIRAVR
mmetsp:Transcript_81010/g.217374  ORF Transcript_81010/g.217374 Transcript_81010/m.217374 type:complete len:373 (+) Transcript_81010:13-1131(+)